MSSSSSEDRERFSRVFAAHYGQILAFAARRVGADIADEVAAETFLIAWRRLDKLSAEPLPWLYGVARNVILRELHASARQARTRELIASERPDTAGEGDGEEHDRLWRAWGELREQDREVLALIAWEELSVRDAAAVLGLTAPVFSVRLHRARRRLDRELQQPDLSPVTAVSEAR